MASVFDYIFNIGGNFTAQISGMSAAAGNFTAQAEVAESRSRSLAGTLASLSYLKDIAQNIADGFNSLTTAGVSLDSQMHDLSAVAGVTGDGLKQIEGFARQSAKAFGTDAAVAVEGYKLLLSQLSPELGKYPDALSAMGDCIQTTSKLMGGDGVAAAQVLTTAMNQYGVSLDDPTAASARMAEMMNVMAAAGQAGSAELPAISAALQQCGMAAKAAGVSFEETNAAIQVLDKAGKKASEGGVALRNVLGQLSKGRFVEKAAAEELQKAGIDVNALGDNSKSLKARNVETDVERLRAACKVFRCGKRQRRPCPDSRDRLASGLHGCGDGYQQCDRTGRGNHGLILREAGEGQPEDRGHENIIVPAHRRFLALVQYPIKRACACFPTVAAAYDDMETYCRNNTA